MPTKVFSDGDIDSVGLSAEHSDMGSLEIKLICPSNQSVVLKNYSSTNHSFLGNPTVDEVHPEIVGIASQYFWNSTSVAGLMNNFVGTTIPPAAYLPDGLFSDLNGCPMNGKWKMIITDNSPTDNGYVFSWQILFKKSIIPTVWKFRDTTVNIYQNGNTILATYWESENVGSTSITSVADSILIGTATGRPKVTSDFKFNVVNNRGCVFDTSVTVKVERVKIDVKPGLSIFENDTLNAELMQQTVTWDKTYKWDFSDLSASESTKSIEHIFPKRGTYKIVLAVSDADQCIDTDTVEITVKLEETQLDMTFNCFTPNGDGDNDFFKVGKAKGLLRFSFVIYNEWGEKMYETNSVEEATKNGWDGRSRITNMKAAPGIYYYYIQAIGKDGSKPKIKGTLQLFR